MGTLNLSIHNDMYAKTNGTTKKIFNFKLRLCFFSLIISSNSLKLF